MAFSPSDDESPPAPRLALASASPYKRALLARLGLAFDAFDPDVDESSAPGEALGALALRLAGAKALAGRARFPGAWIIGADQIIALGERRFSKPGTPERARDQLTALAGRTHELLCAVAVLAPGRRAPNARLARVSMRMRPLGAPEIEAYVSRDQPLGCAGSYKIEAAGVGLFVETLTDDPSAIEGLPLMRTRALLERSGYFEGTRA